MQNIPIPILITILTALITSLIGPTILEWIKVKFLNKNKDILSESIKKDEKIDLLLEQIMEEIKCDRISISQFHNGGNFYPYGKSIKKFSIFYERTNEGIKSVKQTWQNIPVSLFPKIFSLLNKDKEIIITDTQNNNLNHDEYIISDRDQKPNSYYLLAIIDINNNFIGVLTMSYYNNKHSFSLEEWIIVRQKIGAIGSILTDYLKNKF